MLMVLKLVHIEDNLKVGDCCERKNSRIDEWYS